MEDSQIVINGNFVTCRVCDGKINLTQLCKAGEKKFNDWHRNKKTKKFLQVLSDMLNIPISNLLIMQAGGTPKLQASWGHPQIAINMAQWISPEFDVQITKWIYDFAISGYDGFTLKKCLDTMNQCLENSSNNNTSDGYVYCIKSNVLKKNIYKIGRSKREQIELIKDYSRFYGENIIVLMYKKVKNMVEAEEYIKKELSRWLIGNSELVSCELKIIKEVFNNID